MRYTVLKALNGRSTRLLVGATVGPEEIADTVFSVDDLVARKFIEPVKDLAVKDEPVSEEPQKPAPAKARDKGE
tara:strand:+ start:14850 stop:15071 length:222 start_codon:yes stop_codon:yes gene_type:complete